jgi:sortase (surface protein transpeptidase)
VDGPAKLSLDNPVFNDQLRRHDDRARTRTPYIARPASRIQDIANTPLRLPVQKPEAEPYADFSFSQEPIQPAEPSAAAAHKDYQIETAAEPEARASRLGRMRGLLPERPMVLYGMAAVLFMVGLAVSLAGFHANHQVQAQVNKLSAGSGNSSSGSNPPSTDKPSASAVSNYQAAPDLPRYIDIPSLNVHARVFSAGITKSGALATPGNVFDTDWYSNSAKPGQPGAMLVDGHISSWTTHGVFYGLKKLASGNLISITRGDGQVINYKVVKTQMYDASRVDMASLLVSADTSKPGLNLISCSGDLIPGTNEFNKRIAVFATE